jgi:DNA-binding transcriptional LysR family regulator
MLNVNQLRAFYHVAKSLSFSAAAEELFVTQPAVNKQVKLFQEFFNLRLIRKRKGKLYLTDEGKKVLFYASRIFELEKQLEDAISGLQSKKQGSLRVGTTKTYAKYLIPLLLAPFRESYPGVIIELDEGSSQRMIERLLDFRSSLAIVAKLFDNPEIQYHPLLLEEIVLVASPIHHLAKEKSILFRSLAEEPMVVKERGSGTRNHVERLAQEENIVFDVIAETSNMDFIKDIVKKGQAISFVVKSAVEQELAKGELITLPIRFQRLVLEIHLAYLRGYELPLTAKAFRNYLLSFTNPTDLPFGVHDFAKRIPKKAPRVSHVA